MVDNNVLKIKFKKYLDSFLLLNLLFVIFSSLFFIFALIMEINRKSIFLDYFRRIWQPLILPAISILIVSTLTIAIFSWLKSLWRSEEEDI